MKNKETSAVKRIGVSKVEELIWQQEEFCSKVNIFNILEFSFSFKDSFDFFLRVDGYQSNTCVFSSEHKWEYVQPSLALRIEAGGNRDPDLSMLDYQKITNTSNAH